MPLINPVVIGGKIVGAYVDETYAIDGQGTATLTELLQFILTNIADGGNGIYGGSGNSPANTVATALGDFTMRNLGTGELEFTVIGQGADTGRTTRYTMGKNGVEIRTDGIDDTSYTQIITDKNRIYLKSTNEDTNFTMEITGRSFRVLNLPEYANDAAADADASLQSKSIYKLVGNRTLFIKP